MDLLPGMMLLCLVCLSTCFSKASGIEKPISHCSQENGNVMPCGAVSVGIGVTSGVNTISSTSSCIGSSFIGIISEGAGVLELLMDTLVCVDSLDKSMLGFGT